MDKSQVYCEDSTRGERGDCKETIGLLFMYGGLEFLECETEWHDTPPHGKKKSHSLHATVISRNWYVQINTGILEKVIAGTLGHKSSKTLQCYEHTSSVQQQALPSTIPFRIPVALYCFLPNMDIAM